MRKALFVLGCVACLLLVGDIALTVVATKTAESTGADVVNTWTERFSR